MSNSTGCYCVCHNPFASRASCAHCEGRNSVGRVPRCEEPDDSNANGNCARTLPCETHGTPLPDNYHELTDLSLVSEWNQVALDGLHSRVSSHRVADTLFEVIEEVERLNRVMKEQGRS